MLLACESGSGAGATLVDAAVADDATVAADSGGRRPPRSGPEAVNYHRDVRSILEANCVECHTQGGIGPSRLDDWATVRSLGRSIVSAVSAGRMPPWPADDSCRPMVDSRALSQADKARLVDWELDGFLEGNPAEYVAPTRRQRTQLGPPTRVLNFDSPFTPAANSDSYRCFNIGTLEADTYITALDIVPGATSEVHHVQLHRVDAAGAQMVRDLDAAAAGSGYPCMSSGVLASSSQNLFSYRPGSQAVALPPGDAVYIKAGSGLVLQIHYNTQFLKRGELPVPDQTRVEVWTVAPDAPPKYVIYRTGVLSPLTGKGDGFLPKVLQSTIAIDAMNSIGESTLRMSQVSARGSGILGLGGATSGYIPGEIVGMTPHAHAWAKQMSATLQREGGQPECLLDIPRWDYGWQLDYMYQQGVPYGPDDLLHVSCNYDNTAANQPLIDGERRPVQTITFGENTLNEMCLHYLWLRFEYAAFVAAGG
jgi:hypothetical protein